jgi:hypothetical protein
VIVVWTLDQPLSEDKQKQGEGTVQQSWEMMDHSRSSVAWWLVGQPTNTILVYSLLCSFA